MLLATAEDGRSTLVHEMQKALESFVRSQVQHFEISMNQASRNSENPTIPFPPPLHKAGLSEFSPVAKYGRFSPGMGQRQLELIRHWLPHLASCYLA